MQVGVGLSFLEHSLFGSPEQCANVCLYEAKFCSSFNVHTIYTKEYIYPVSTLTSLHAIPTNPSMFRALVAFLRRTSLLDFLFILLSRVSCTTRTHTDRLEKEVCEETGQTGKHGAAGKV
jgi:hypothetical protein